MIIQTFDNTVGKTVYNDVFLKFLILESKRRGLDTEHLEKMLDHVIKTGKPWKPWADDAD